MSTLLPQEGSIDDFFPYISFENKSNLMSWIRVGINGFSLAEKKSSIKCSYSLEVISYYLISEDIFLVVQL